MKFEAWYIPVESNDKNKPKKNLAVQIPITEGVYP